MKHNDPYFQRKDDELALLNRCLATPLEINPSQSPLALIDQKFQIAGALRAEQCSRSWAVTETARAASKRCVAGPFEFRFGYQRADLSVQGPPIYASLRNQGGRRLFERTLYTGSGMSAIAGLVASLLRLRDQIEVLAPRDCYGETRELLKSFGKRVRVCACGSRRIGRDPHSPLRVLLVDSSVASQRLSYLDVNPRQIDLVMLDTTCWWRSSSRIDRIVRWAFGKGLPLALVRSHAKLDCLGIEYGRLGSIVLAAAGADPDSPPKRWMRDLACEVRESIRLFGAAPILSHFAPYAAGVDYDRASARRTATIIRNTRRLGRLLETECAPPCSIIAYQHGMYLTLAPHGHPQVRQVKAAIERLCDALVARGLPVKHAGSFGFDFVAIEWFVDPLSRANVIRIAPGDLPVSVMDEVAEGIADWWAAEAAVAAPHAEAGGATVARAPSPRGQHVNPADLVPV